MNNIDYINNIIPLIKKAGRKINNNFRFKRDVATKGASNYVTDLDKSIESMVTQSILEIYPNEVFISEEDIHYTESKSYWILDPIDGTTNLLHNYKSVAISLSHIFNGEIVFGVVYCPNTYELFYAEKGKGAYLMTKATTTKLFVSSQTTLKSSLIGFGCPYDKSKIDLLFSLLKPILMYSDDIKRLGPASLDICYVAAGRLDAYLELDLEVWDFSAGAIILNEAGGKITDFYNNETPSRKTNILATNRNIHVELLKLINLSLEK